MHARIGAITRARKTPCIAILLAAGLLGAGGCRKSASTQSASEAEHAARDVLAGAPQAWPEFLAWAAEQLAQAPAAVPLPETPRWPDPEWPVLRLDELLGQATIACDWQARPAERAPLATLGPFRSDQPAHHVQIETRTDESGSGVWFVAGGFTLQREAIGTIAIEIRQPFGSWFDLIWSRAGWIRVPLRDQHEFQTLRIETDGLADWTGPLNDIAIRTNGAGDGVVEIRALRFFGREDAFPLPVGARRVRLDRETRTVVYVHTPTVLTYRNVHLPVRARLQVGLAQLGGGTADFQVIVEHDGSQTAVVSHHETVGGRWVDETAALEPWSEKAVSVILKATGATPGSVACWSNPVIYSPVDNPPAVLIYLIDALAAKHIDLYGYERPTMPRLRALAERGAWFAHMSANSPRTVESVADLMLSLPTERHNVWHASAAAPAELVALPEVLRAAGFATASFSTNVYAGPRQNMDQGFDHYFDRVGYWWTGEADRTVPIEDLLAWLERHRDRPTFIYVHTAEPHAPYTPPPGFAGRWSGDPAGRFDGTYDPEHGFRAATEPADIAHIVDLYDEEVAYADSRLGKFLDALQGAGLLDRTHFFVIADHGEAFQEHGTWEHELNLHGELLRIPLVVAGPRVSARGRQDVPVQMYDLMPTILDMFGLPEPYPLVGTSLWPVLRGEATGGLAERSIIASNFTYRGEGTVEFALLAGGRWKLMLRHLTKEKSEAGAGRFLLYDLDSDREEQQDVLAAHPELARRLMGELIAWRRAQAPFESAPGREQILDAEQLRQLGQLGYIQGAASQPASQPATRPARQP